MRISKPVSGRPAGGASKAKRNDASGFSVQSSSSEPTSTGASGTGATGIGSVSGVGAVDAVLALQGVDSAGEGRERALRKGRRLLDALDRLQLSVLEGKTSLAHLGLMKRAMSEERASSGDDGLDNALEHIEVRTAVEIAKLERHQQEMLKSKR